MLVISKNKLFYICLCILFQQPDGIFETVGVVSWGRGCGGGRPGVYARTYYGLSWIDACLKDATNICCTKGDCN